MLLSMTGYGTGKKTEGEFTVGVNIQSLNSRYLEQRFRLPNLLIGFENKLRERLASHFCRGELMLAAELALGNKTPYQVSLNRSALSNYLDLLDDLKANDVSVAPVSLRDILNIEDVISKQIDENAMQDIEKAFFDAFEQAVDNLKLMQKREGNNMHKDIISRLDIISAQTQLIKNAETNLPDLAKNRIEKLQSVLPEDITAERFAQEVTIMLSKMDISEEIVRLESHIQQFRESVGQEPPVGTKLNFIIQEIHREANTIASKSQGINIVTAVIEIKEQTERIREQLRNVQ